MSITCVVGHAPKHTVEPCSDASGAHDLNTSKQKSCLKPQRQYSRSEIYHIAFLLRQKLVYDLVHPIIQHAQLYEDTGATSKAYTVIRVNSPRTCMIAPQIKSTAVTRTPVRAVKFSITSKDQGYAAYPGVGSWTWFTAGIVRAGCQAIHYEREVLRNVTTSGGFVTQHVSWSAVSENHEEAAWVRSLQCGDAVVVNGHAEHLGWVNTTISVQVTVSQALIVR
ncbi:hypothetical protein CERZMDRAFT_92695 [Cercospora zeae-maydis SCOH1-5]|uniref:Uncharacterized protein n=1 Tax=Cercospora zeae-maydis SCOH1-5 TaxID=717836 RepID=A0A6A6FX60_9PEZI|nr:hypothetical protein CERZMDRAFT_92695 [Cercospora zeae-maydis SCOH1-5]